VAATSHCPRRAGRGAVRRDGRAFSCRRRRSVRAPCSARCESSVRWSCARCATQWRLADERDDLLAPLYRALERHGIQNANALRFVDTGSMIIEIGRVLSAVMLNRTSRGSRMRSGSWIHPDIAPRQPRAGPGRAGRDDGRGERKCGTNGPQKSSLSSGEDVERLESSVVTAQAEPPPFWGRPVSRKEWKVLREILNTCRFSRHELASTICEGLRWVRPNGRLKARECYCAGPRLPRAPVRGGAFMNATAKSFAGRLRPLKLGPPAPPRRAAQRRQARAGQ